MDITRTTVPGTGTLYLLTTRAGQRFGVLANPDARQLMVYGARPDPDAPLQTIVLEADEADQVADLLHSRSVVDRLAVLERALATVTGERP
jgi:TrkA domain protein